MPELPEPELLPGQMENDELGVHDVIIGLRSTMLSFESLPREVQDAVEAELDRLVRIKQ